MAIPQNYTEMMAFISNTHNVLQHLMNMDEQARVALFTPEKQTKTDKERSATYYSKNKEAIAIRRRVKRSGNSEEGSTQEVPPVVELTNETLKTI